MFEFKGATSRYSNIFFKTLQGVFESIEFQKYLLSYSIETVSCRATDVKDGKGLKLSSLRIRTRQAAGARRGGCIRRLEKSGPVFQVLMLSRPSNWWPNKIIAVSSPW